MVSDAWSTDMVCSGNSFNPGCGCTLRIFRTDLFKEHEHDMSGPRDEAQAFCKGCGRNVSVSRESEKFGTLPDYNAKFNSLDPATQALVMSMGGGPRKR